jgi:hypothetical protein
MTNDEGRMTNDEGRMTNEKVQKSKYVKNCNLFLFNYKNMKRELFAQCIPYDENINMNQELKNNNH